VEKNKVSIIPKSRTMPRLIDELASTYPAHEALVGSTQRFTYAQLKDEVMKVARRLHGLRVVKGDKVAILMGNKAEWVVGALAISSLGAVMVAMNTWSTPRELEYLIKHSDAKYIIAAPAFLKYDYAKTLREFEPLTERFPLLKGMLCVGSHVPEGWLPLFDGRSELDSAHDAAIEVARDAVKPTDIAFLLYTSGSTSTPKGVQLLHAGIIENMWNIGERQGVTEQDRLWLAVSLFWGLGCVNAMMNLLTHGGCIVLQESFDAGEALGLIEREKCTIFYGTPNMAQALHEHPDRARHDLSSLRGGMSMGTPEQIMRVIELGARQICNIYGLSETYGNSHVSDARDPLDRRLASVGKPLPGVIQRIVDPETGMEQPPGLVGEIRVKGYVTPGYYKDAELTAQCLDEAGFFKTGDLGYVDEDGYLYFRGRLKEMIKTGGINVAPAEVEAVLMSHPAVYLAQVVGVPDDTRDEILAAVVVLNADVHISPEALIQHCKQNLAAYKVPRLLRFIAEQDLPLTTTGKIQKNRITATFFSMATS
jgi:fatty-acyl-CoA synthase